MRCVACGRERTPRREDHLPLKYRLLCDRCRPSEIELARAARDRGMALASANAIPWRDQAMPVLEQLAATGRTFSAADITDVVGLPESRNAVGALFGGAARRGLIQRVGFTQATRRERHASTNSLWQGKR